LPFWIPPRPGRHRFRASGRKRRGSCSGAMGQTRDTGRRSGLVDGQWRGADRTPIPSRARPGSKVAAGTSPSWGFDSSAAGDLGTGGRRVGPSGAARVGQQRHGLRRRAAGRAPIRGAILGGGDRRTADSGGPLSNKSGRFAGFAPLRRRRRPTGASRFANSRTRDSAPRIQRRADSAAAPSLSADAPSGRIFFSRRLTGGASLRRGASRSS